MSFSTTANSNYWSADNIYEAIVGNTRKTDACVHTQQTRVKWTGFEVLFIFLCAEFLQQYKHNLTALISQTHIMEFFASLEINID